MPLNKMHGCKNINSYMHKNFSDVVDAPIVHGNHNSVDELISACLDQIEPIFQITTIELTATRLVTNIPNTMRPFVDDIGYGRFLYDPDNFGMFLRQCNRIETLIIKPLGGGFNDAALCRFVCMCCHSLNRVILIGNDGHNMALSYGFSNQVISITKSSNVLFADFADRKKDFSSKYISISHNPLIMSTTNDELHTTNYIIGFDDLAILSEYCCSNLLYNSYFKNQFSSEKIENLVIALNKNNNHQFDYNVWSKLLRIKKYKPILLGVIDIALQCDARETVGFPKGGLFGSCVFHRLFGMKLGSYPLLNCIDNLNMAFDRGARFDHINYITQMSTITSVNWLINAKTPLPPYLILLILGLITNR